MTHRFQRLTLLFAALTSLLLPVAALPSPAQAQAPLAGAAMTSGAFTGQVSFASAPAPMTLALTDAMGAFGSASLDLGPGIPGIGLVTGTLTTSLGSSTVLSGRWVGGPAGGYFRVAAFLTNGDLILLEGKWYASGSVVGGWRI